MLDNMRKLLTKIKQSYLYFCVPAKSDKKKVNDIFKETFVRGLEPMPLPMSV